MSSFKDFSVLLINCKGFKLQRHNQALQLVIPLNEWSSVTPSEMIYHAENLKEPFAGCMIYSADNEVLGCSK